MTYREERTIDGLCCDAPGCERIFNMPCLPSFDAYDYIREYASKDGWSCWAGRGQRHYCPVHSPKPGHKMRAVWGVS
jgi:hypothetical protein